MSADRVTYEELRPLLFSIAYRMLGSVNEAEDVVQEAFVRFHRSGESVESPKAYLSTITTRLAIDHLKSARARREQYVGEWLPEPLVDAREEPAHVAEMSDSLSLAFLVLLESLSPVERAVFLLREVFDYDYGEIARTVGRSEENCRQLLVRAKRRIDERKPRFDVSREQRERLAQKFFAAAEEGDVEGLAELLAADVTVHGDGGGKAPQWATPIAGRARVAKLLVGTFAQAREHGASMRPVEVNGQPGVLFLTHEGLIVSVMTIDVLDGVVQAVRSIINPEKLSHLGAVADVRTLLRARGSDG
jgi:RNA polymerase sigma-70 factor (ECF subfamily)